MTQVATRFFLPDPYSNNSFGSVTLNADNEKIATIMQAPKTGTIDRVAYRMGTVTTEGTLDIRIETIDSSGLPTGTLWATNTNATRLVTTGDAAATLETTLTAGASVNRGDLFAVVINLTAGGGDMTVSRVAGPEGYEGFPSTIPYTNSWGSKNAEKLAGAIRYSDATYPFTGGALPVTSIASTSFSSGSATNERGNVFIPTFDCKVNGVWVGTTTTTATADFTVRLLNSSSTIMTSRAVEAGAGNGATIRSYFFDSEQTLDAGSTYRITCKATGASNLTLRGVGWTSTMAEAMPRSGWGFTMTTRNGDAGAWTDTANSMHQMGVIISSVDDGAAGGGSAEPVNYGFAN